MCAGPPSATRLLTQLPTSVGSCSDRRQSTSSQASGGGATRRPASDARCRRPGAQGSQAEPNDYRCRQRQCSPPCRRRCAASSSATTRSSPRAAAPGPTASRSRRRPPRRSSAAPANVPSSAIHELGGRDRILRTVTHSIWGSSTRCAKLRSRSPRDRSFPRSGDWGNSELPPRTLRSLRREPQSLTALRILFSPSLRVRVTG